MEFIMDLINEYMPVAMQMLLVIMFGCIGKLAQKYIADERARAIVKEAVGFAEQVYKTIHGHDKYLRALEAASMDLAEKGIRISPKRLEHMIEAAVCEMNKQSNGLIIESVPVDQITLDPAKVTE